MRQIVMGVFGHRFTHTFRDTSLRSFLSQMTARRLRTKSIPLLIALALGSCAPVGGIDGPIEVYDSTPATRMFAASYRFIDNLYIQPVEIGTVATDGLAALNQIDPQIAVSVSGQHVQLASSGAIIADLPAPRGDDVSGWANVTVDLIDASRAASDAIRQTVPEALYQLIIDDALASLDRYTRYASASDAAENRADREGFGGVGITIGTSPDEGVDVLAVLPDTPAALSGLEVSDRIVAVDGTSVLGLNVREVVKLLRGPIGTQVGLTVQRGGTPGREVSLTITRAYIIAPTVLSDMDGDIAVIRIASFNVQTTQDVERAIVTAYARAGGRLSGIILDLRNNPGGLLDQGISVADLFLSGGLVGSAEGRHPESRQRFMAFDGDMAGGLPMVLLINGNTASAAEVLAAALQDLGRAVVVGSTSFGKGTVQTVNRLPNDGELTLTWAALHAPSGYIIHQLGIRPNVCTTGYGRAEDALGDATQHIAVIAAAMRRWRTHRLLELDDETTLLRAQCEPETDLDDIDVAVARTIIADPALFAALLNVAPRDFGTAQQ